MHTSSSTETGHSSGGGRELRVSREATATLTTRLARSQDIVDFYGVPSTATLKAMVAEMDGKVVGLIGVVRELEVGKLFCDFDPKLQPYLRSITIWRAVKASMRFCDEYRGPVVAIAEHAEGCRLLHRLGWTHLQGDVYAWLT